MEVCLLSALDVTFIVLKGGGYITFNILILYCFILLEHIHVECGALPFLNGDLRLSMEYVYNLLIDGTSGCTKEYYQGHCSLKVL